MPLLCVYPLTSSAPRRSLKRSLYQKRVKTPGRGGTVVSVLSTVAARWKHFTAKGRGPLVRSLVPSLETKADSSGSAVVLSPTCFLCVSTFWKVQVRTLDSRQRPGKPEDTRTLTDGRITGWQTPFALFRLLTGLSEKSYGVGGTVHLHSAVHAIGCNYLQA